MSVDFALDHSSISRLNFLIPNFVSVQLFLRRMFLFFGKAQKIFRGKRKRHLQHILARFRRIKSQIKNEKLDESGKMFRGIFYDFSLFEII